MGVGGQCHASTTLPPWERAMVPVVPQMGDVTILNRIIQCGMKNFLCHVWMSEIWGSQSGECCSYGCLAVWCCVVWCSADQITASFLVWGWKDKLWRGEALCTHHQVFFVCFETVHSDWSNEHTPNIDVFESDIMVPGCSGMSVMAIAPCQLWVRAILGRTSSKLPDPYNI